jgi:hypothetical protein
MPFGDDPVIQFAFKMALCLAIFLLGAAWLRRAVERAKRTKGPPPESASVGEAIRHLFGNPPAEPPVDHQRRLYRQTIKILAMELRRLDPDHEEAREALALLELDGQASGDRPPVVARPEVASAAVRQDVRTLETQQPLH